MRTRLGQERAPSSPEMISPDDHAKGLVCIMSCMPYKGAGGLGCTRVGGATRYRFERQGMRGRVGLARVNT